MMQRSRSAAAMLLKSAIIVSGLLGATVTSTAWSQTPSPRTPQAPSQEERLAECERMKSADRQRCEQRVRAGKSTSSANTVTANKPVSQQQKEGVDTNNRAATDPGVSTNAAPVSSADQAGARTRTARTGMSQRSEEIKNDPKPPNESNPGISTDAAATRTGNRADERTVSPASADPSASSSEQPRTQSDPSSERATTETPRQDRARSRPNDNSNTEPRSPR
jgi:hypothetical protein